MPKQIRNDSFPVDGDERPKQDGGLQKFFDFFYSHSMVIDDLLNQF